MRKMNGIIFLCGNNESGKTTTIKKFFEKTHFKSKRNGSTFFEDTINDKKNLCCW